MSNEVFQGNSCILTLAISLTQTISITNVVFFDRPRSFCLCYILADMSNETNLSSVYNIRS